MTKTYDYIVTPLKRLPNYLTLVCVTGGVGSGTEAIASRIFHMAPQDATEKGILAALITAGALLTVPEIRECISPINKERATDIRSTPRSFFRMVAQTLVVGAGLAAVMIGANETASHVFRASKDNSTSAGAVSTILAAAALAAADQKNHLRSQLAALFKKKTPNSLAQG
jgi:hypothetical protein